MNFPDPGSYSKDGMDGLRPSILFDPGMDS